MDRARNPDFFELLLVEGLYQTYRAVAMQQRVLFSREQFIKQAYTVQTSVDGLVALAKHGAPFNIVVAEPSGRNGGGAPR